MAGRPKKFKNEDSVFDKYMEFITWIRKNEYKTLPSVTNFSMWLNDNGFKNNVKTIFRTINEYCPSIKKDIIQVMSDTLAEGAALGMYNPTMTIFCLKNWCSWTDKQEKKVDMTSRVQKIEDYLAEYED